MSIPRDLLVLPGIGDLIEVRFVAPAPLGPGTASWQVKTVMQRLQPDAEDGPLVDLAGRIVSALWSTHADGRIDRQLEIINRVNEHVRYHCSELRTEDARAGSCDWIGRQR